MCGEMNQTALSGNLLKPLTKHIQDIVGDRMFGIQKDFFGVECSIYCSIISSIAGLFVLP